MVPCKQWTLLIKVVIAIKLIYCRCLDFVVQQELLDKEQEDLQRNAMKGGDTKSFDYATYHRLDAVSTPIFQSQTHTCQLLHHSAAEFPILIG